MKRRWSGLQAVRVPEESSSEVTSSSAAVVMSPGSLASAADIGEVDLEFWDLDLHGQSQARLSVLQNGYAQGHNVLGGHHLAKSDTSSISGK